MGWVTTFLQMLPAIMAAITQLWPLIQGIINALKLKATTGSMMAASSTEWWLYCPGQALAGTAGMALLLCLQPRSNAMARAWRKEKAAEQAALGQVLASREQAAKAFQLRASMMSLAPEHQAIVKGN